MNSLTAFLLDVSTTVSSGSGEAATQSTQQASGGLFGNMTVSYTHLAGLAALTENEGLDQTASAHSTEMVKEKYFDYKSKDGKTPFQRMMENNVQFHTASEVIATTRGDVCLLYTSP